MNLTEAPRQHPAPTPAVGRTVCEGKASHFRGPPLPYPLGALTSLCCLCGRGGIAHHPGGARGVHRLRSGAVPARTGVLELPHRLRPWAEARRGRHRRGPRRGCRPHPPVGIHVGSPGLAGSTGPDRRGGRQDHGPPSVSSTRAASSWTPGSSRLRLSVFRAWTSSPSPASPLPSSPPRSRRCHQASTSPEVCTVRGFSARPWNHETLRAVVHAWAE